MMAKTPIHLDRRDLVNLGSFYTSKDYVEIVWSFIKPYINENTVIFDPACGYGNFLIKRTTATKIGNDIDMYAVETAKQNIKDCLFFNENALFNPCRRRYNISPEDRLIIIGNPPYNDVTSQAKKTQKTLKFKISNELKHRDIGISFLRMFALLEADYVCVLHPLSYLIKQTNFNSLKDFKESYVLKRSLIINSNVFPFTSKNSPFPIIIALYEKNKKGMNYEYVRQYRFKTIEGKSFSLNDFDYIGNYINKYPKKNQVFQKEDVLFYTLRDMNALSRNKTFLEKPNSNAIKVELDKLDYYIYVDVFKDFIDIVPYYLRNLDIIIDNNAFQRYKKYFISYALKKRKFLRKFYETQQYSYTNDKEKVLEYFKSLLGRHYVESKKSR